MTVPSSQLTTPAGSVVTPAGMSDVPDKTDDTSGFDTGSTSFNKSQTRSSLCLVSRVCCHRNVIQERRLVIPIA